MKPLKKQHPLPEIYTSRQPGGDGPVFDCDCGACVEQVSSRMSSPFSLKEHHNLLSTPLVLSDKVLTAPINNAAASIFHLTRGNLLVLNQTGAQWLQHFERPACFADLVKTRDLQSVRRIESFLSTLHELGILRQVDSVSTSLPTPCPGTLVAWLHLNNQCNLQCQYCYVRKSSAQMSEHTAGRAISNIFAKAVAGGYTRIKLKYAGGEPTMTPELLMQTHLHAEKLAERYHIALEGNILTNGVTISDPLITFSRDHNLKWAISLDGLDKTHNAPRPLKNGESSAQRILSSIDRLQQHGIAPHIPITLTRSNLNGLPALVQFLLERQLRFSFNFYRAANSSNLRASNHDLIHALRATYKVIEANLPDYSLLSLLLDRMNLKTPHLYPCAAGHNYCVVGHDGRLSPCQMLVSQPADVTSETFENVAVTEKEGCQDCSWQYFCAGGCPMEAFHAYGRFDTRSPYCDVYRALAPDVLRLEALRILKNRV